MRRLNIRLAVLLMVAILVSAVGVHFLHAYQVVRNADFLLRQAEAAEKKGDLSVASRNYSQYLKHRDDAEAHARYAAVVTQMARRPEAGKREILGALGVMEAALRSHPELSATRLELVDFLMRLSFRLSDAIQHLTILEAADPKNTSLDVKHARCLALTGKYEPAAQILNQLVGYDAAEQQFFIEKARGPHEIEAYAILSELLRTRFEDAPRADAVIDQLIVANPQSAQAFLERGRYQRRSGNLEKARDSFAKSLELQPHDVDTILAATETAIAARDFAAAQALLDDGLKHHPKNEDMYRGLSALAREQGKLDDAISAIERGLKEIERGQSLLPELARLQAQKGDLTGVRATIGKMRDAKLSPEIIQYWEARELFAERKWLPASERFKHLRPLLLRPDYLLELNILLADCYERLAQPDDQLEACRAALAIEPNSVFARLSKGRALLQLGKTTQATAEFSNLYKALDAKASTAPALRNTIMQLIIAERLQKPKEERDWADVDAILEDMLKDEKLTPSQKIVLKAQVLLLKDKPGEAKELLDKARQRYPNDLSLWLATANLLQRDGKPERTLKVLDNATAELGDELPLRLARLSVLARMDADQAKPALAKLEQGLEKFTPDQQLAFYAELGNAYYRIRDYDNARRCRMLLAEKRPEEPRNRQMLFDLAVEFGREEDMASTTEEIGRTLGAGTALYKYCQATRLVAAYRKKRSPDDLAKARKLIAEATRIRPEWHELPRVEAEIDELEGHVEKSISNFQRSLEIGPANASAARHLVDLLFSQGRMLEAKDALRYVGKSMPAEMVDKMKIEIDFQTGEVDAALGLAEKAVKDDPEDASKHFWYAQMLDRAGKLSDAEREYRLAVEKNPKAVQNYLMLVNHLVGRRKHSAAEIVIRNAQEALPPEAAPLLSAQAYDLLGDMQQAERYYREAVNSNPEPLVLRNAATFYMRTNNFDKAMFYVNQILKDADKYKGLNAEHANWARRAHAQLLAARGTFRQLLQAVKILEKDNAEGKADAADLMLAAGFLAARRERSSQLKAIELLERLQEQRPLNTEQLHVLAQLHLRNGNWANARERMLDVLAKSDKNPVFLAEFAQMLLDHDELDEAGRKIEKLEDVQPGSLTTVGLKAKYLAKIGGSKEASRILLELLPDPLPAQDADRLPVVAEVLEAIDQQAEAEKLLRRYVELEPRGVLTLANFLGSHGNLDEALTKYDEARKSQSLPDVIQAALKSLRKRHREVSAHNFAVVEGWLHRGLQNEPTSTHLQLQMAELRDLQGRYADVINMYRSVLNGTEADQWQKAVVKNNLAFVLAMSAKTEAESQEALKLTKEAIEVLGPTADLLDTQAMVYLMQNNAQHAVNDLRTAIGEDPAPTKYFHLALAELGSGNRMGAREALRKAKESNFDTEQLSILERKNYEKLERDLGAK